MIFTTKWLTKFPVSTSRRNCDRSAKNWTPPLRGSLTIAPFSLGPDVAQFEKDFAKIIGAEGGIGFNSGTPALHVAMLLLGVGPGDEVVNTPFTFVTLGRIP